MLGSAENFYFTHNCDFVRQSVENPVRRKFRPAAKGQSISKCLLGVFNSPKKWLKQFDLRYHLVVKSNCFVRFLGELKTPKRHFEIN